MNETIEKITESVLDDDSIARNVTDVITNAGIAGLSISNPVGGITLSIIKDCSSKVDELKLKYLIHKLSQGLNEEMYKNELVNYISGSNKRAIFVVDTFRKAIIHESLIAVYLMGIILDRKVKNNDEPDINELIVMKALENANDIDLNVFWFLERNKLNKSNDNLNYEQLLTCKWAAQNRLFEEHITEWNIKENYTDTEASEYLMDLMKEVPDYLWKES